MPSILDAAPALGGPSDGRPFGNPEQIRTTLFDNVLLEAQKLKPISNQRYTMNFGNVGFEGPESFTRAEQKRAILEGKTLGRRLRGHVSLMDNETGQEIENRKVTFANIPWMSPRGTFIFRGNEYAMANQFRLRPGIYTRRKENGELEAHVNVMPGKGTSHRYFLDPKTGIFRINIGQARIPLFPVLRSLGIPDKTIRDSWGNELFSVNARQDVPKVVDKLHSKLVRNAEPGLTQEQKREQIAQSLTAMELDPKVTARTLGRPVKEVGAEAILATTNKLLAVQKGEAEEDDRDHLGNQILMGPEDIFAERIKKSLPDLRRLLWKATLKGNLKGVQPGFLEKRVQSALLGTGLSSTIEEINPAELMDQQYRVTRMGEGGIPSYDAIPDDARGVQPSHFGFVDPVHTPESNKIGVDSRLTHRTMKGPGGELYSPVRNVKSGKEVWRTAEQLSKSVIAFPGELKSGSPTEYASVGGHIQSVPRGKVEYELGDMTEAFGPLANMVPMKTSSKGQRVSMGARMLTQAMPLLNAETPLVQAAVPGQNFSFEELYGSRMGAVRADQPGRVLAVTPDEIKVRYADGTTKSHELYSNFPYARKSFIHNTALVMPGQRIDRGDLLARSNFTDPSGSTALGLNARVAYIPFRGANFEDAVVVSEGFAKRATSEHMYQHDLDLDEGTEVGRNRFVGIFPSKYSRQTIEKFDDDGIVKPGTRVNYDDPLILAVKQRTHSAGKIGRPRKKSWADATVTWKHHAPGVVTDVANTKNGPMVVVKSSHGLEVGDKLSGRYGDKGVIAEIVPDNEMPQGADGRPYEVALNPLGIISRVNPSQIVETILGKIAEKTGRPYRVPDFDTAEDLADWAYKEAKKHGVEDLETVIDPDNGRAIPEVFTGNRFIMKLHHTAESKEQARSIGQYSAEGTPAKGGKEGAKRVGMLELSAMLAHGAYENIRDVSLVRGQQNEDYWMQTMAGHTPPEPEVPFVYKKFVDQLKGSGINVTKENGKVNIMALTERDIDELAGDRQIQNSETVRWGEKLAPIEGGLFDEKLTGGHGGNRWSFIQLPEPYPSPVMEEPIRRLLGLTKETYRNILKGTDKLGDSSGPGAIGKALKGVNVEKAIQQAQMDIKSGRKTKRDLAVRKMQYLEAAKRSGVHPGHWMLSKVPVLPPIFRPVTQMANKTPLIADANQLYQDVFDSVDNFAELASQVDDVGEERLAVYDSFRAVTGLGDPISPKHREKKVKGLLKQIFGSSPKYGTVQRKLLGSTVDLVGRAVIAPNADLDMDQVGLPESQAWDLYKPFVIRRLVRRGMSRMKAMEAVDKKIPAAREELLKETQSRPVVINRAPVLHRYGVMAFNPRLTKNKVLEVSPLIVGGFGADFDGDAMQIHVPSRRKAVDEAYAKMMPSKNLFSSGNFDVHYLPSKEYVGGLYTASKPNSKKPTVTFATMADAVRAYRQGKISIDQPVEIVSEK